MTCNKKTSDEIYNFFDDFNKYESLVDIASGIHNFGNINESCDSLKIDNDLTNILSPDNICKKFKYLYSSLFSSERKSGETFPKNNHCSFLIYWLNKELNGNDNNTSICVKDFYDKIKKKDEEFFFDDTFEKKVHNLDIYDIENINTLFNLYSIKNKISSYSLDNEITTQIGSCSENVRQCNEKYKEGIIKCTGGCSTFLHFLGLFQKKYEAELIKIPQNLSGCKPDEIVPLPDCNDIWEEHQNAKRKRFNNIMTFSILPPVFGFFFMLIVSKFTPVGQFLSENVRNKIMGNIAHENERILLTHSSDDMKEISDNEEYSIGYYSVRNY
ncbi:PIR Superfamily Protein [Plasmodium ovale wallikeri]|uniref:Plasmodium vivax Vir protein, putative n=2 Tax=Plasmodium ovale TaxID=36330 RepID=A0A1C3KIC9_PLAOA|nr:PIR Superfamily Protein [Plasmodium ovale wallikeri]SBT73557.1 Plasmodium vivax Vir protein, putative [Plasmodium ovale]